MNDRMQRAATGSMSGDDEAVLELLQRVSRRLVAMTASALARSEGERVSLPEYRVLVLLASGEVCRPSELAEDLEVTRPAIAQILGRLTAGGLVSRRRDHADHRSSMLTLTRKGTRVVRSVLAEREGHLRPALAALGKTDRKALGATLSKLDSALGMKQESVMRVRNA